MSGGGIWDYWSKVKTTVEQRTSQFLEEHADETAALKAQISDFGRTAGEYIDRADRQIGEYESSALAYIKQQGGDMATAVREQYDRIGNEEDGISSNEDPSTAAAETLYSSGADRVPVSRLDAQIMTLNSTPKLLLDHPHVEDGALDQTRIDELLVANPDLARTHRQLVPSKLEEKQFWLRYFASRKDLEDQDRKRKELLAHETPVEAGEEDDGWGSSDEA